MDPDGAKDVVSGFSNLVVDLSMQLIVDAPVLTYISVHFDAIVTRSSSYSLRGDWIHA